MLQLLGFAIDDGFDDIIAVSLGQRTCQINFKAILIKKNFADAVFTFNPNFLVFLLVQLYKKNKPDFPFSRVRQSLPVGASLAILGKEEITKVIMTCDLDQNQRGPTGSRLLVRVLAIEIPKAGGEFGPFLRARRSRATSRLARRSGSRPLARPVLPSSPAPGKEGLNPVTGDPGSPDGPAYKTIGDRVVSRPPIR